MTCRTHGSELVLDADQARTFCPQCEAELDRHLDRLLADLGPSK